MRIIESIANIGIEAVKRNIGNSINEAKVKARLKEYVERNQKANWNVTLDEEVDFEGLAGYICSEMMDDVKLRFWGDRDEREAARKRIADKAVTYASAKTKLSDQRARKLVFGAIDILAKFFRDRANKDLRFFATEIEDTVIEEHENTREFLKNVIQQNKPLANNNLLSVDRAIRQIDEGQTEKVGKDVETYLNAISAAHALFPYYGFRMTPENGLISYPLTEEAKTKYPVNYQIIPSNIRLGGQPVEAVNMTVLEQAYRHQLPIAFNIQNARKFLGDIKDPIQSEADKVIGTQAILTPPEFPPAFPCSVTADNEIVVPYLLLRTKEILDDGSYIVTNEEQRNYNYDVRIILNKNNNDVELTISTRTTSNRDYLKSLLFQKHLLSGECIILSALESNTELLRGALNNTDTDEIDTRIELFRRIVQIEDFFSRTIATPKSISAEEQHKIYYLSELICGAYKGYEEKLAVGLELTEQLRKTIIEANDTDFGFVGSYSGVIFLFDQEFSLHIIRKYMRVRVKNLRKLKEKASVLDIGDEIKITFVPGENCDNCYFVDRFAPEDKKATADESQ